jgi:hypothetical protein
MSAGARSYLRAADGVHRGSLLLRLRNEVLAILPRPMGQVAAGAAHPYL